MTDIKSKSEYIPHAVTQAAIELKSLGTELEENRKTQDRIIRELRNATGDDERSLDEQLDILQEEERILSDKINDIADEISRLCRVCLVIGSFEMENNG